MLEINVDDLGKGRVSKILAVSKFMLIESLVVMGLHKLDDIMFGVTGLNDHLALFVSPSCAARHLLKHIKSAFVTAKIRKIDHRISIENAHNAHCVKIQALGHHLCTHKDISAVL